MTLITDDRPDLAALPLDFESERCTPTARQLERMLRSLDSGASWDDAFADYWQRLTGEKFPSWPPTEGRTNWVWLTDLLRLEHAVDLGSPFGELAASLCDKFSYVSYLGADGHHGQVVIRRFGTSCPNVHVRLAAERELPSVTADCVVFVGAPGWSARVPAMLADGSQLLSGVKRLLRPGGWFAFLAPNPVGTPWTRPSAQKLTRAWHAYSSRKSMSHQISNAGFSDIRRYLLAPSFHLPITMVPDARAPLRAWHELAMPSRSLAGQVPGSSASSFGGVLLLART